VGRKNPKKQSVRLYHRITPFEKWDQSNPGITAIKGFSAHGAAPNVTSPMFNSKYSTLINTEE
jgi:hypothetical protein